MTAPLVFPPGVVTGKPFRSMTDALGWFRDASEGAYGDFSAVALGGLAPSRGAWVTTPILPRQPATLLVTVPAPDSGLDVVSSLRPPYLFLSRTDDPNEPVADAAFMFGPDAPAQVVSDLLLLWRQLSGHEWAARNVFNSTTPGQGRRDAAKYLGWFETALEVTAAQFTDAANRWISTAWVDATNAQIATDPPSPFAPNTPRLSVGSYTLVTA